MLNPDHPQGSENQDQQKLSVSDWAFHAERYPFIQEFSEFIASVSMNALKYTLMTYQQRLLANAMWEAHNYGGSEAKCKAHLKELYGPKWYQVTSIEDHMENPRPYYEYVLILEHQKQWDEARKRAKLPQSKGVIGND